MSILTVGAGQTYATLNAAVSASTAFDTINVLAGTYYNDFANVGHALTIQGIGGMAEFIATIAPPGGKAILTVNGDITIDHLAFSGAAVPDGNGAGIRYEGGNLVVTNSWFHHNQDGLLGGAVPGGTVSIDHSEFGYNGTGDGLTHNLYIGQIDTLTVTNSYFHDVAVGHEIKSRALTTVLTGNRIQDGPDGTASYSVDLPNGGAGTIAGNVIQKAPGTQNWAFIHLGGESDPSYANTALAVNGNTVINDLVGGSPVLVLNQSLVGGVPVTVGIAGNTIHGLTPDQLSDGPIVADNNSFLALPGPLLDTSHPWDVPEPMTAGLLLPVLALAAMLRRTRPRRQRAIAQG